MFGEPDMNPPSARALACLTTQRLSSSGQLLALPQQSRSEVHTASELSQRGCALYSYTVPLAKAATIRPLSERSGVLVSVVLRSGFRAGAALFPSRSMA